MSAAHNGTNLQAFVHMLRSIMPDPIRHPGDLWNWIPGPAPGLSKIPTGAGIRGSPE